MEFFIELDRRFFRSVSFQNGKRGVAHDAQEPGAGGLTSEIVEKTKRPQGRFLNDIFGVLIVTHNKTGQVVGRVEMRQHFPFEIGQARGLG